MRLEHPDPTAAKGWYAGPWNSDLPIAIGYANTGVDEPHAHTQITEIYVVTRGTSEIRVEQETITLHAGDLIIVEPGEAHTFLSNSPDYFHVVLHTPALSGDDARRDKQPVSRARLGLELQSSRNRLAQTT
jgi:mannose-6-phosphate isomerase-like protein (cupin superfamily)